MRTSAGRCAPSSTARDAKTLVGCRSGQPIRKGVKNGLGACQSHHSPARNGEEVSGAIGVGMRYGEGTPAPWEPPRKLVVRGPYRHARNPMISSVLILIAAEALLFGSWPLLVWMGVFFLGNVVYFPLVEEKGLAERFGQAYREYKKNVPRWLPRRRGWPFV